LLGLQDAGTIRCQAQKEHDMRTKLSLAATILMLGAAASYAQVNRTVNTQGAVNLHANSAGDTAEDRSGADNDSVEHSSTQGGNAGVDNDSVSHEAQGQDSHDDGKGDAEKADDGKGDAETADDGPGGSDNHADGEQQD
jgi:hypothetical protein